MKPGSLLNESCRDHIRISRMVKKLGPRRTGLWRVYSVKMLAYLNEHRHSLYSTYATNVLKRIDPVAATKAGVK